MENSVQVKETNEQLTTKKEELVKDYYEAESWQFSGCWD